MSNKFLSMFRRSDANKNQAPKVVSKSSLDICLNKIGQHIRLDTKYKNLTYGKLLLRTSVILKNAGKDDAYINSVYDQLCRMMMKRRGLTLPVGIDAQNVQRYREICTLVLTLIYLVKVLTHENLNLAIQVEHEGEIYNFSAYQDYLFKRYKLVGRVSNRDNLTLTVDVAVSLRLAILNDLLMNADLVSQWFGLFPDMLRLVYRSLQNNDDSIFTIVTDEFINLIVVKAQELNSTVKSNKPSTLVSSLKAGANPEISTRSTEPTPVVRKPLNPNVLNIGALINKGTSELEQPIKKNPNNLGKLSDSDENNLGKSSGSDENIFTENSKPTKHKPSNVNKLQMSPAMSALINKSKKPPNEDAADISNSEVNYFELGMEVLRISLNQTPAPNYADLATSDGDIVFNKVLLITLEIWRNNVKKHCSPLKIKDKDVFREVIEVLKEQGLLILNERGKEALSGISETFIGFNVEALPDAICKEVELLTYDGNCIEISDLKSN